MRWSDYLTEMVDCFCERYNAVVLCDHTSNYRGKYGVMANLVAIQRKSEATCLFPDLVIHIGEVSGAYIRLFPKEVWRVSPDGEIRDSFKRLKKVIEMEEARFFEHYVRQSKESYESMSYYDMWIKAYKKIYERIPELPFSSAWIAQQTAPLLPENSVLHLGILNSLRTWNYFPTSASVEGYSNVGGFGIDGSLSSMLGASLVNQDKLYYIILGDLSFFYDINSLRGCFGTNVRIMLINNGLGFEMKYYKCAAPVQKYFGSDADDYFAAKGHNGEMSRTLVKNYAKDIGMTYLSASNKEEYIYALKTFVSSELIDSPMILEVFTDEHLENDAQKLIDCLAMSLFGAIKHIIKEIIGPRKLEKIIKSKKRKYV